MSTGKNDDRLRHLSLNELNALHEFITQLRQQFGSTIRHVWLFGSMVRGDFEAESDIDLLIVVGEYSWSLEKNVTRLATQTDCAYGVVLSDHMVDTARFVQMAARGEPLYHSIQREGIDLWPLELQPPA